jgi:hypothetical protein
MGLFNKKTNEEKPAMVSLPSIFMNDDSEGDHGKETMLDYQLSYILRLANTSNMGSEFAERVVMKLIGVDPDHIDEDGISSYLILRSVKVWKQWERIDLLAEIEANYGNGFKKYVIVIEDKAYTNIHDDQLSRYAAIVEDYYKGQDVEILYWVITFFDKGSEKYQTIANQCKEAKGGWNCISFDELAVLTDAELQKGTYNDIIDEFWVKRWS